MPHLLPEDLFAHYIPFAFMAQSASQWYALLKLTQVLSLSHRLQKLALTEHFHILRVL